MRQEPFQYDGVTNNLQTPYFIDLINSGSLVLPDLEIPVPERFVKPEERQHLYVPGSPVATVGIVGTCRGSPVATVGIVGECRARPSPPSAS